MQTLPAVLLMGPTASGKSALALALAERFPIEIVSVDSAQVYEAMDIGTAKPDRATRARVPHHLIDIITPLEAYSAQRFSDDALAAIAAIRSRGRVPLLVGGTMLYFKALTEGLSRLPGANAAVRRQLADRGAREGWPALHRELFDIDPDTAGRVEPADAQRIQRALEVFAVTGMPLSRLHGNRAAPAALGRCLAVALLPQDRARLHREIAARFDAMLSAGLVEEVIALRERFALTADIPSMRAVGYRQVWDVLAGRAPAATLRERGIAATRQLAKRQITWLRSLPVQPTEPWQPDTLDRISQVISGALERAPA